MSGIGENTSANTVTSRREALNEFSQRLSVKKIGANSGRHLTDPAYDASGYAYNPRFFNELPGYAHHQKIISKSTDPSQYVQHIGGDSVAVSQLGKRWREHMNRIIFVLVALGVVGCNVEESDNSTNQDNISNSTLGCTPRSYEELSIYGYGCKETIPSSSSNGGSGDAGGTTTNSTHPASIARYAEYEPNNVPENANPVAFPIVSGVTVPGIEITGAVWDVSDESDYFILSPNQSGVYAIYLCADTCTEHPTDSMVAIRVIDQFGTVIAGNPLYEESTKIVTAGLDAGIPYYVQVFGFETHEQGYQYKLVIID